MLYTGFLAHPVKRSTSAFQGTFSLWRSCSVAQAQFIALMRWLYKRKYGNDGISPCAKQVGAERDTAASRDLTQTCSIPSGRVSRPHLVYLFYLCLIVFVLTASSW